MPAPRSLFVVSLFPALAAVLVTSVGRAEEPARSFGERGQVAFDDIVALSAGGTRLGYPLVIPLSGGMGGSAAFGYSGILGYSHAETSRFPGQPGGYAGATDTAWFAPSVDVFVGRHFSLGGTIAASYARFAHEVVRFDGQVERSEGSGYGFAVAPRVGYVIPVGASFAFWPRLTIGYNGGATGSESNLPGGSARSENRSFLGVAELGLVARIHRRVYLRAAPELVLRVSRASGTIPWTSGGHAEDRGFAVRLGASAGLGVLLGD
jgi:hypothetical protein